MSSAGPTARIVDPRLLHAEAKPRTYVAVRTPRRLRGASRTGRSPAAPTTRPGPSRNEQGEADSAAAMSGRGTGLLLRADQPDLLRPVWRRGLFPDHRPEQAHHDEEAAEQGDQADPAVGRVGAGVRHQLQADPEDDRPDDEQEREQELRVRVRDAADPASSRPRPSSPTLRMIQIISDHDGGARSRTGWAAGRRRGTAARGAMLADGRPANGVDRRGYDSTARHPIVESEANRCRDPLRSTWPLRRAPSVVGRRRRGPRCCWSRCRSRRRSRAQLSAGGFILDDLESARAKALLETELGCAAVGAGRRLLEPDARGRHAGVRGRRGRRDARHPARRPHVARVVSHLLSAAPGLGGRPHRLRHRLPRPAAGRLARRAADPARAPARRARARRRAGRRARLLRRRPDRLAKRDLRRSELISLPLAALALLFVFGSLVAAGVPLVVGGAAVIVALAGIFVVASIMPMSIFVLNLATLLGLGLGVDYSLLMTSRFREELALRPDGPDRVADAVRVTVATAGRAVFFSGLTVLLGLLGLVLFEFMILRSVGIAGAIVVGLAVAVRADPAAGAPDDRRRRASTGSPSAGCRRGRRRRRRVVAPRPSGDAPPGRGPDPDARAAAPARLAVPARPVQRPRRLDPAARGPVARRVRPAPGASSARASSRRSCSRSGPTARRPPPPTWPPSTTTRAGSPPTRGSRRVDSLVDVDPRLTLAQYTLLYGDPNGPRDRYVADRAGGDDPTAT